ncbi:MAG: esterase family protein [Oscillospiraceae bacterium]|jgi:S-formylglutathione hydrolase FrmB|nr:esterase family protein [Oscillospiraceae bacterium]
MALLQVHFRSQVLQLNMMMDVILPERPCPRPDGRWPTLYLLHGIGGDHTVWQRRTLIERYVEKRDVAVVMPEVHRSFYTDMRHGGRYWTYISEEVPQLCERMFPLSPERADRYVAGLSMGGYGAMKMGLRCPDRFAAAASLSGAVDVASIEVNERGEADVSFFEDIFGDHEAMRAHGDDLCAVAEDLIAQGAAVPRLYMACGTEDFLLSNNRGFMRRYGEALSITYEEGPGSHTWDFWNEYILKVLDWMGL